MIFDKLKANTKGLTKGGLTQGLLAKKKRKEILHGLAKTNLRKGLGALGRGLMFRRK